MSLFNLPSNVVYKLRQCRRGIEKEGLRVTQEGLLSEERHPKELGSALTHPSITTDYSEALLEFVTGAYDTVDAARSELLELHVYTANVLEKKRELIWTHSMPCLMIEDGDIPLAQYGSSNVGQMKTIYRRGLGHRYGRTMQTIAGIHYNWSIPESFWHYMANARGEAVQQYKNRILMKAVRNIYRSSGIITYLLSASPAICPSFLRGAPATNLKEFNGGTLYKEYGTSLRLSDIGYSNNDEERAKVRLDTIEHYASDLLKATQTPNKKYEQIGLIEDGVYRQLNVNNLQLENEYYAPVRPKQIARNLTRVANALLDEGIGYLELRIVDIDPFDDIGISEDSCYLIEAFLLACTLREETDSADPTKDAKVSAITKKIVEEGRDPNAKLEINGAKIAIKDWLKEEAQYIKEAARLLDEANGYNHYVAAVERKLTALDDPNLLPSAKVMQAIKESGSFFRFAFENSQAHHQSLISQPLTECKTKYYQRLANDSIRQQSEIESNTELSFTDYLKEYFDQDSLNAT